MLLQQDRGGLVREVGDRADRHQLAAVIARREPRDVLRALPERFLALGQDLERASQLVEVFHVLPTGVPLQVENTSVGVTPTFSRAAERRDVNMLPVTISYRIEPSSPGCFWSNFGPIASVNRDKLDQDRITPTRNISSFFNVLTSRRSGGRPTPFALSRR